MSETDLELLGRYSRHNAEEAFAEIVRRHLDLVYSAALRQVRSPQLAQEVAQTAFLKLARRSSQFAPDSLVIAWLYRVTCREATDVVRREARRQLREQIASHMNAMNATAEDWTRIEPLLDEAMHALDDTDRAAILLRYFENKSLREVGQALGTSDDAAQKRVSRAIERLREFFAKRGISVGASGLVIVISVNAVQSAPVGLAVTISTAAVAFGGAITTATAATKAIAMTTIQKTLVAATLVTAISAGIYEARLASNLRIETQGLRRQQTLVTERMRQLQSRHDAATNRLAALGNEIARMENNNTELLRLRGEVARLRQDSQELARLRMPAAGREAPLEDESWLERVRLLKQRLAQTPEAQIPEHQYLTDEDWLMAAKHKLDTEGDFRTAFSALDLAAEGQFLRLAEKALTRYLEANKGEFPTELLQLKAFFESPPGDDVLQRYEVVPGKSLPQVGLSGNPRDWLITSKYPRGEGQWALGRDGLSGFANPQELKVLAPAIKALYDASPVINGRKSIDIHQLPPYLTTPEQQAAYQKLIEGQGNRSAAK